MPDAAMEVATEVTMEVTAEVVNDTPGDNARKENKNTHRRGCNVAMDFTEPFVLLPLHPASKPFGGTQCASA